MWGVVSKIFLFSSKIREMIQFDEYSSNGLKRQTGFLLWPNAVSLMTLDEIAGNCGCSAGYLRCSVFGAIVSCCLVFKHADISGNRTKHI